MEIDIRGVGTAIPKKFGKGGSAFEYFFSREIININEMEVV